MAKAIRVALVNNYMILLEGLRSLLRASEQEIHVIEIDVKKGPRQRVDVTLLDTYGERQTLGERVRSLAPTQTTERSWCSVFPTDPRRCVVPCVPAHTDLSPRLCQGNRSLMVLRLPQAASASS